MMSKVEVVGVEIERADNDRKPVAVTIYRYDDGDYVGRRHYLTEASRGRLAQWLDVTPAVIIRDIAESPAPAGVTPATVEDSSAAELPVNEAIAAELAGLVTELHNVYEEIGIDTFATPQCL